MVSIGAAEARKNFAEIVERAKQEPVVVARRGRPEVVVVSAEQYERMQAAVEELDDVSAFDAAMEEEGEDLPWEQVKADLGWA